MEVRAMDTEKRFKLRPAQAIIELAIGLFCITLVMVALLAFLHYIVSWLNFSRDTRAEAGRSAMTSMGGGESYSSSSKRDTVTVSPMAAEYIFGSSELEIKEEVHIPNMKIPQL